MTPALWWFFCTLAFGVLGLLGLLALILLPDLGFWKKVLPGPTISTSIWALAEKYPWVIWLYTAIWLGFVLLAFLAGGFLFWHFFVEWGPL